MIDDTILRPIIQLRNDVFCGDAFLKGGSASVEEEASVDKCFDEVFGRVF